VALVDRRYVRSHLRTWCAFEPVAKTFCLGSDAVGAWFFAIALHLPSMARIALFVCSISLVSEPDVRG
jgi:hypothetical protein